MSSGHNIILKYYGNLKKYLYVLKNKIKKPCEMNSKNQPFDF